MGRRLPRGPAAATLALAVLAAAGCAATYREVGLSEPLAGAASTLGVAVERVLLPAATIDGGMDGDTALVVELALRNHGARPYTLDPVKLWCLMQIDASRPDQTRLLPPSVAGPGRFPGPPAERNDLPRIEVPAGETRSFWVLFAGYKFPGSEIPRRITLTMPDPEGRPLEVVVADPGRGTLRWNVAPQRNAIVLGVQNTSLFGSYVRADVYSTRVERLARAGRFLWDVGVASQVVIQTQGALVSPTFAFTGAGVDAHLTAPLLDFGEPRAPVRLGVYGGAEADVLIALQGKPMEDAQGNPVLPSIYGVVAPEGGVEIDFGALRAADTPFPLTTVGTAPLPHWSLRIGYVFAWIGHGTADGYTTSVRLIW